MYKLVSEHTERSCSDTTTTHCVRRETGNIGQVTLLAEHPVSVAEDDGMIVFLLGRLRPYGCDYTLDTPAHLEEPAHWLLTCIRQHHEDFYPAIAGFFAFVLIDKRSGDIRLVSDHVGSIPLYFSIQGEQWWVTDSLTLLEPHLHQPAHELDSQAIYNYCFHHCIPAPDTVYQGIKKLQPGAELSIDRHGNSRSQNLYNPDYRYSTASTATLMAQCRQVIEDAVRRNIAPQCGAFLSGGLDSSTVAGMFAKHQPGAPTFSIGFDAKGYDETEYARITAGHFKTTHHEHYLKPQDIVDNFVDVAGYFDEPFGNSSAMAAFVCARVAKEHGIAVMLAGDGGDEIFGGNERYAKQKVFETWQRVPVAVRKPLDLLLGTALGSLPVLRKARSYIDQAAIPLPDRMDTYNFLNRFDLNTMFEEDFLARVETEIPQQARRERYNQCRSPDPVEKMMYLDWKFTLADNDLVKVSRMCRKAGVEVRYPLFEKEVVDFSCTVPASLKLPGKKLRDFYKNTFRGFLPDETLSKTKHGFGLPFGVWMKQQPALQNLTKNTLEKLKERKIFKPTFIDTTLSTYESGHSGYYGELIWILVVLELWLTSREK